ncbi:MAG: acyltransferase [Planctomycetota bacterium]|jgi:acetyltransferase-like isoleucine patch superfamily enzyme
MKATTVFRRFLVPSLVVTLVCWIKFRCFVSPRAEVELSPLLTIGKGTEISSFTKLKASDGPVEIGKRVAIATGCFISADKGGVVIGDYTMCGPNVSIVGNSYRHDRVDVPMSLQEKTSEGIHIDRDVWIGAGATVLDGARIGEGAIVSAGSLVYEEVRPYAIVVGVPARPVSVRFP